MAQISKISGRLVISDVEELVQSLGSFTDEQLSSLKAQLCPEGSVVSGDKPEDVLKYWIENDPNPTREALQEKLQTLGIVVPDTDIPQSGGVFSKIVGALSARGKGILKSGRPPKLKDVEALMDACVDGDSAAVRELLHKVKPNVTLGRRTPLLSASLNGHLNIVEYLVREGADVNFVKQGKAARPALNAASSQGHYEVVEYLLDSGASVNAIDGEEQTALHEAAFQGHPKVARLLIERGANIERKSDDGSTPLMVASSGGKYETLKLLLDYGAKTSIRTPKYNRSPLHNAASHGTAKVVELLLTAKDCQINDQDKVGQTPLIMAVRGHINRHDSRRDDDMSRLLEIVKKLVKEGADLNTQTKDGKTALMYAAMDNRYNEAKVLVEAGADLDIKDKVNGWSAICFAAEKTDVQIAKLLYEAGANIGFLDKKRKRTVLDVAKDFSPTVYKMLLSMKTEKKSEQPTSEQQILEQIESRESTTTSSEQASEDTGVASVTVSPLTLPRVPSYYKYDERYPGIRFFGSPWQQAVTSDGAHIKEWGDEIGIEFDIPPGAVPKGKQVDLSVWPCSAGPFELPEDYQLASPVFLISPFFEFSYDIILTIYHFYALETKEDCENMAFLSSPATPLMRENNQKPVYQFKVLSNGLFQPSEDRGHVSLKHFCLKAVGKRKRKSQSKTPSGKRRKEEKHYVYKVYREIEFDDIVLFSVFPKVQNNFKVLEAFVKEYFSKLCSFSAEPITIEDDKVSLKWPSETGWNITSDRPCEITREQLDLDDVIPYPPVIMIKLAIKKLPLISESIEVDVLGITETGKKFNLNPKPRPTFYAGTASMQSQSAEYWLNQLPNTPPYTPQSEQGFSGSLQSSLSSSSDPTSPPSTYHPHKMSPITASPYPLTPHPSQTASQPILTPGQNQNPGFLHVYEQPSPTSQANVTSSPPSDAGGKYCTMKDLINNIDTTDWYALGVQLTTNVAELNIISCDHRNDTRGALFKMFNLVLRDNPNLTWPTVVKALETIKDNKRAKKIRNKFCKNSDT